MMQTRKSKQGIILVIVLAIVTIALVTCCTLLWARSYNGTEPLLKPFWKQDNVYQLRTIQSRSLDDLFRTIPNHKREYFNPAIFANDHGHYDLLLRTQRLSREPHESTVWHMNLDDALFPLTVPTVLPLVDKKLHCKDKNTGAEDARFLSKDQIIYNTSCHDVDKEGGHRRRVMCTSEIDGANQRCYLTPREIEKNWTGIEGYRSMCMYSVDPPQLVMLLPKGGARLSRKGISFVKHGFPVAAASGSHKHKVNNGSNLVSLSRYYNFPRGFFLSFAHSRQGKVYRNFGIIWYIPNFDTPPMCFSYTKYFRLGAQYEIEYVSSIAHCIDDPMCIVIGAGFSDREFGLHVVHIDELLSQMVVVSAWTIPEHDGSLLLHDTAFCINLDRSINRMMHMQTILPSNGFKVRRVSAYDGIRIARGELNVAHLGVLRNEDDPRFRRKGRCGATGVEILADTNGKRGRTCSHLALWRELMTATPIANQQKQQQQKQQQQKQQQWYIVCEDDVEFMYDAPSSSSAHHPPTTTLKDVLAEVITEAPMDADFIYLGYQCSSDFMTQHVHADASTFVKMKKSTGVFCTHCYAITPRGALLLTAAAQMYTVGVIDIWMCEHLPNILNAYLLNAKALVKQGLLRHRNPISSTTVHPTRAEGIAGQAARFHM